MSNLVGKRYEILSKLGSGSIGDVFLVNDTRKDEKVCLKILRPTAEDLGHNFIREFRIVSALQHPGLIPVYDFGIDPSRGPFFSMEFAAGGDLNRLNRVSPDDFSGIAVTLCQALEYIHNRGLIHGDIKPSNILIDDKGRYKLVDFGLAFISGDNAVTSSGSAAFISPEALRKDRITSRSDIYSLGLLFYELIFGKPLYEGSAGEIISGKIDGLKKIPAVTDNFGGKSTRELLTRMIAPRPEDRFESAGMVLDRVEEIFGRRSYSGSQAGPHIEKGKFVGRSEELEWLSYALESASENQRRFFYIGGETGVGKSRLVDEFRINSEIEGYRFFKVFCRENDRRPLSPLISLLEHIIVELDPQLDKFAQYGPDLKRLFPEKFEDIIPAKYGLSDSEIRAGRRRMFDNLALYLHDLSREEKLAVFIEDIHWADSDSVEFIKFLKTYNAPGSGLVFICVSDIVPGEEPPGFLTEDESSSRILPAADEDNTAEFIRGILCGVEIPSEFDKKIFDETGGNYLYASEIIRGLSSDGWFERARGKWKLKPGWESSIIVPEGIKSLLSRTLDRLNPEEKNIAELAAVIGRSFNERELSGLLNDGSITEPIDNLIANGLFEKTRFGRLERIYFTNGQLAKMIYSTISKPKLQNLHSNIAAFYSQYGASSGFLGYHYAEAGDFENGFINLFESGESAEKVYSYEQAAEFYKKAKECAEKLRDSVLKRQREYRSLLGLGKSINFLSPVGATGTLSEAMRLAVQTFGSGSELAEAAVLSGQNHLNTGDNDEAHRAYVTALSAAESSSNSRLSGEAEIGLGFVADKTGNLEDAERHYLRALDFFAEVDYPEGSCKVLNYLGIIRKRQGDLRGAEDFYRRSLDICLGRGFLWSAMNIYGNIGNLFASRGDYNMAQENYSKSLEISKEISDRRIESVNLLNIGHALNETGNLEEAEQMFFKAIEKFKALGDKDSEAITLNNLGFMSYRKARINDSLKFYESGLSLAEEINRPRIILANLAGLSEVHGAIADFKSAEAYADRAAKLAVEIDDKEQLATILPIRALVKDSMADKDGAIESVGDFLALDEDLGEPRQRIKALMMALKYQDDLNLDKKSIENKIERITGDNPETYPVFTVFNAKNQFASGSDSSPEIWLARIDGAINRAGEYFQFREKIELMSAKLRLLAQAGDEIEARLYEDKLNRELAQSMAGLGESLVVNLKKYLGLNGPDYNTGVNTMNKVSREERLSVLLRIARTINSIRESEPLLNKILDLALETLSGERGFIMLYSDDTLDTVVARNIRREDILGESTISKSSALEVARSGKPIMLSGADNDVSARQSVEDFRISSLLCVPLAVKGKVHGIVYVDSRSGTIFSDDDLDFLVSFADLAGIAFENARMAEQLNDKNVYLQKQVESIWGFGSIVGRSSPMQRVFRMAESVADTDVTVVLTGESGTGKEILARAIHLAGPRKKAKFVPVDCGALTETLLESELFGHIKGAFTGATSDREGLFEVAQGGTIFLDEITNTSKNFQTKLLRVLQENEIRRVGDNRPRKINVRVISATNKRLESEVEAGNFREDLYYRLNVVNILLPNLRERHEDISMLAAYFLEKVCKKMNIPAKKFSSEALNLLEKFDWPGNVRQLENLCERLVVFARDEIIDIDMLPPEITSTRQSTSSKKIESKIPVTKDELKKEKSRLDRMFIEGLLRKTGGNVMQAAKMSGMDRSQIHHMMSKFDINGADFKE